MDFLSLEFKEVFSITERSLTLTSLVKSTSRCDSFMTQITATKPSHPEHSILSQTSNQILIHINVHYQMTAINS